MQQLTCTQCNETKPVSEYQKQSSRPKGYRSECKVCSNTKRQAKRAIERAKRSQSEPTKVQEPLDQGVDFATYDYVPPKKRESDKDILIIALGRPYPYDYLNEKLEDTPERLDRLHDMLSYCREKKIFPSNIERNIVSFSTVRELALA